MSQGEIMQARTTNPAIAVPGAMQALQALAKSTEDGGVSAGIRDLVHLRASQINGCSVCVDMHSRDLKKGGEADERIFAVAAWRESPYFTDAERAALALTEAATRISDGAARRRACLAGVGMRKLAARLQVGRFTKLAEGDRSELLLTTPEVQPQEVRNRRRGGEDISLLDVREREEVAEWAYPEAVNIPL